MTEKELVRYVNSKFRVKIKSLAEEARIIRKEEKKYGTGPVYDGLYLHRINVVRLENRHTQLAYAFLRGKKYSEVEQKCNDAPDINRVAKIVSSLAYKNAEIKTLVEAWLKS